MGYVNTLAPVGTTGAVVAREDATKKRDKTITITSEHIVSANFFGFVSLRCLRFVPYELLMFA